MTNHSSFGQIGIILGMMSYDDSRWSPWVLGEQEAIEHVKFA
jgi:hypothetical protein